LIGKKLETLREERELTKKAVATKLGIHESTYGKYELGKREPNLEMLTALATIFDCSTDYILGLTGVDALQKLAANIDDEFSERKQELKKIIELMSPAEIETLDRIFDLVLGLRDKQSG